MPYNRRLPAAWQDSAWDLSGWSHMEAGGCQFPARKNKTGGNCLPPVLSEAIAPAD